MANKPKLYWCETLDHDDDWFVVAPTKRAAQRAHEIANEYDAGFAVAHLVAHVPAGADAPVGPATNGTVEACGLVVTKTALPRVARHYDQPSAGMYIEYCEGGLQAAVNEMRKKGFDVPEE